MLASNSREKKIVHAPCRKDQTTLLLDMRDREHEHSPSCSKWRQEEIKLQVLLDRLVLPVDKEATARGDLMTHLCRDWVNASIRRIEMERTRSAETHLLKIDLPALPGLTLYLKDETTHLTGSLKHRLARSLLLYALCNGRIGPGSTLVEASSGSTAVSEAYFARLLGLRFIAVMPRTTTAEKQAEIVSNGGEIHLVNDPGTIYATAQRLADETGGCYLDQFTFAERAVDWRSDNIAASIFAQMAGEEHHVPTWLVCGAGTGGTSATIGRYIRHHGLSTMLCLADPLDSVYHRHIADPRIATWSNGRSVIEGIGRAQVEASFVKALIDRTIAVPDAASIAAARVMSRFLGRRCGGSTGTNLWAAFTVLMEMAAAGEKGSLVTILCDSGDRYRSTLFDDAWLAERGLSCAAYEAQFERLLLPASVDVDMEQPEPIYTRAAS
jgi:cysteine synthase A